MAASLLEAGWLARRVLRERSYSEPLVAWIDVGFGVAGLFVMAVTTTADDRTAWLNWMCPVTIGAAAGASVAIEGSTARIAPAILATSYLATVHPSIRSGGSQMATALANAVSYAGFFSAARFAVTKLRGDSEKLALARAETVSERERLAAERQRNYEHRLLHDSALQTLEGIASGLIGVEKAVRSRARSEARRLRQALAGIEPETALADALERLAAEFAAEGLEVVHSIGAVTEPEPEVTLAVVEAVRESLRNVVKHAGVSAAVVRADTSERRLKVTVRDQGAGFDLEMVVPGFGLRQSLSGRMAEVDGTVEVWSKPGRGTRVTLWVPTS
jgi:signal transduction histidine kinase